MSTTWIRLSLSGDPSKTFPLPTLNISTYSKLSQVIHSIFRVSADDFPAFELRTENDDDADILSPHLWDLGVYFAESAENAVTVFVRFKPSVASLRMVGAAHALLALSQHQEAELPAAVPQQSQQQQRQKGEEEEVEVEKEQERGDKRARSSSGSSDSSNPVVVTKRARLYLPSPAAASPPSNPTQQAIDNSNDNSNLSELGSELERELKQEDEEKGKDKDYEDEDEEEDEGEEEEEKPRYIGFVDLRFTFTNRMTRSHGVVVPELVLPHVPSGELLADFEDKVKSHASDTFLSSSGSRPSSKMTERQALALGECLAVKILVKDDIRGGDALRTRLAVGEYAMPEAAAEGVVGAVEWVVRGTVEMWREEDIAMEVLRRASPTAE